MDRRFRFWRGFATALFSLFAVVAVMGVAHSAEPGRFAFLGTDNNIYACSGTCFKPRCVTCPSPSLQVRHEQNLSPLRLVRQVEPQRRQPPPMYYTWPTFSPDGSMLAFAWAGARPDGNRFGVSVYDFTTGRTLDIFASATHRVAYIFWPPGGKKLSFLLEEPRGLSLVLAELKESTPVRIVLTGVPLFFDWAADAQKLVVHVRTGNSSKAQGAIELIRLTTTSQAVEKVLTKGRISFRTPSWSPDGHHLAYVANIASETYLVVADRDGAHPRRLASLPVGMSSFVWSPDSRHVAFSTAVIGQRGLFHGIKLLDVKTGGVRQLTDDDLLAYFFSPDARYLAYVAVPEHHGYYVWKVLDLKSGKVKTLEYFILTRQEMVSYRYFDQLALSHTIWSPDSKELLYAGVPLPRAPSHGLMNVPAPHLWIVPVDGGKPRSIAPATIGFFSPAGAK